MGSRAFRESARFLDTVAAAMPDVEREEVNRALMRVIEVEFEHVNLPPVDDLVRLVAADLIRNTQLYHDMNLAIDERYYTEQISS